MKLDGLTLPDSSHFTPHGRSLLVSLGVVTPDPLRVEAERWLLEHRGPKTEAVAAVGAALAPAWSEGYVAAARRMRATPWLRGAR